MQKKVASFCNKSINFGLYLLAFSSSFSISATQAFLMLILLSWIALMILKKEIIFAKNPLNYPIMVYVSAVFIAALFGVDFINSAKSINKLWITLTFFAMLTFIDNIKMLRRLIYILLIAASIASVYGVLQHLFPGFHITKLEGKRVIKWVEGSVASTGFFGLNLTYGGYLLLIFSLSFTLSLSSIVECLTVKNRNYSQILFYILSTFLILAGIISSMARNAWVGLIFAVFFITLFIIGKRRFIAFLTGGIIFLLIIMNLSNFHSPLLNRFKSIFNLSKNVERIYIWRSTIDMITEHPFTGVGMNNYSKAIKSYRVKYNHDFSTGSDAHAHNNILTQTAEQGIIGVLAFLWIWVAFFKEGIKIYNNIADEDRFRKSITLGGLSAIIGFHMAGMFENNFGDAEVAILMWFIMGLVFLMRLNRDENFY